MTPCPDFVLSRAARVLARGGVIAHPTEGVYGLACDARRHAAIERVLTIKRRDPGKGLILLAADIDQLLPWFATLDTGVRARLDRHWPGPVTFIVPAARDIDPLISGGRDTVAARVTAHPLSAALCRTLGHPLISTSANRSQQPPPRTASAVRLGLGPELDLLLAGPLGGRSAPTQIRDARTGQVLRSG